MDKKLKVIERVDNLESVDPKELSLVPDLVIPPKFKMPTFEKDNSLMVREAKEGANSYMERFGPNIFGEIQIHVGDNPKTFDPPKHDERIRGQLQRICS